MSFLRGLLDRLLLVGAVIVGGLVPGFISQYRQRLGGRLDQARIDLAPWQHIADHFYHGSLPQLIQYHLASTDRTFHSEGNVILSLARTVQQLQSAADALRGDLLHQVAYLALHADMGLVRATFGDWVPTFALSLQGMTFAAALAVLAWLLFHTLWWLLDVRGRRLFGGYRHYA